MSPNRGGLCSTRRACGVVGLATSSYYHRPQGPTDRRQQLEQRIITLSNQHPRWGYRVIHQLVCREGLDGQSQTRPAGCGGKPASAYDR